MLRGRFDGLPTAKTRADGRASARLASLLEELSLAEGFVAKRDQVSAIYVVARFTLPSGDKARYRAAPRSSRRGTWGDRARLDHASPDLLLGRLGGVLVRPFASLQRHRLRRARKSGPCLHDDIHDPQVQILRDLEIVTPRGRIDIGEDPEIERTVAPSLPSVRTFMSCSVIEGSGTLVSPNPKRTGFLQIAPLLCSDIVGRPRHSLGNKE